VTVFAFLPHLRPRPAAPSRGQQPHRRPTGALATLVAGVVLILTALTPAAAGAQDGREAAPAAAPQPPDLPRTHEPDPREVRFGPLRMLTDGAENAEAYWSRDGELLVFQSNRPPFACDQIYTLDPATAALELVSTGAGRTTCAYFAGEDDRYIVYASTHAGDRDCPPPPDRSQGYVWPIHDTYDIYRLDRRTGELVRLTDTPGYDAEPTLSPDGRTIVFTSVRDGDLDIYTMNLDGGDVRRLTDTPGYDGGPFFGPEGERIVYRARHPHGAELADYQRLLAEDLVRPGRLEVYVMDADGSDQRQVTDLGCASFAPFFHPSGEQIIFSSNYPDVRSREFDLWLVGTDGTGLERVTWTGGFDGFPMFSPDGTRLVFGSNRHNGAPGETNVFVTEWRD
jgi:Tol biopolymer transport system component